MCCSPRYASDGALVRAGFIDQAATRAVADRVIERFDVRTSRDNPPAQALSGGNLQKFVVGRELDREPAVLLVNQPTWGVDAGAAALIRQVLSDMARDGAAVLVISQDLDEIFEIADRIAVISRGELSAAYPAGANRPRAGWSSHGRGARDGCGPRRGRGGGGVRLQLEARPQPSQLMTAASPVIAIVLTVVIGGVVFSARGLDPLHALYVYFVEPVTTMWSIEELIVKAAPLVLIGAGLAVCFRANLWNIGAEGQFTAGAIAGGAIPVLAPDLVPWLALPLMLVLGMLGGMAWAAIPALLRNRFAANEILTSLMLVYVAQYLLDWLVRGPWRDPHGYNFPKTVAFQDWQLLPTLGLGRVHLGAAFAVIMVVVLLVVMSRTLKGFEIRVSGDAPAGRRIRRIFPAAHGVVLLRGCRRARGACGDLRGGGARRSAPAPHLARIRIHRDHRGLSGTVESDWSSARRHRSRNQLPRRRGGAGGARDLGQDGEGLPGSAALPHSRLRHPDSVPGPVGRLEGGGTGVKGRESSR